MINIDQVYLNGHFVRPEKAQVSAFDRGFVFGDGVYEVIPVFGGRPFRLSQHLERLNNSLLAIGIKNPLTAQQWTETINTLIDNKEGDQSVYLQVTRGPAARDHVFPKEVTPTVFAYATPIHYPESKDIDQGIAAITVDDIRWQRCDIKATALLANVMLRQQASEQGVIEAILLRNGMMTEGAASNIFIVKDNILITPAKSFTILPGITRDLVVELAGQHGVDCREQPVTESELRNADEVWMTSSTKEILPITRLDNKSVGSGKPGELFKVMYGHYQKYKKSFRNGDVD